MKKSKNLNMDKSSIHQWIDSIHKIVLTIGAIVAGITSVISYVNKNEAIREKNLEIKNAIHVMTERFKSSDGSQSSIDFYKEIKRNNRED
jgi:hypothetical protein